MGNTASQNAEEQEEKVAVVYSEADGHKQYMEQQWWWFLPFYIYIVLAVIYVIMMLFAGVSAGPFLGWLIFAVLIGLLIWWLCDIRQLGWAWFILLLPLIIALFVAIIGSGVTAGIVGAEALKQGMRAQRAMAEA